MDREAFVKEAELALGRLPKKFRRLLDNVTIVVEDRPSNRLLREVGLEPREDALYGLYQGVPLADRSVFHPPLLPDKITLFYEPLARDFPDERELRREIRRTVIHEIAHFFGMDDEEIDDLGY